MVSLMETIVVRPVTRLATVIVTVRGNSYGSLAEAKLARLRDDLTAAEELLQSNCERIIVDLSGITIMGSAFLRELFNWIATLDRSPEDVILCGDRTGLLKLCATDRWLTVRPDLISAIDVPRAGITGPHVYRGKCGSGIILKQT